MLLFFATAVAMVWQGIMFDASEIDDHVSEAKHLRRMETLERIQ
jgi:hypothetical protein